MATRHERLLLAYPRWHRRLHGPDMLTALDDCAAAGRPVSAARLVLDGLACRLRVRGVMARLVAACVSVVAAAAVAAAVSWVSWQATVRPWPTVEQAVTLAQPMLPPGTPEEHTRRDGTLVTRDAESGRLPTLFLDSPGLTEGGVELTFSRPPAGGHADLAATARQAAAAGWHIVLDGDSKLIAERDGMRVRVINSDGSTFVHVNPAAPASAYHLGWAGAAIGALLGWLAAAAAIARHRRLTSHGQTLVVVATVGGVCLPGPAVQLNLYALATGADSIYLLPPWIGYVASPPNAAALMGVLCLGAAWFVTIKGKPAQVSAPAAE